MSFVKGYSFSFTLNNPKITTYETLLNPGRDKIEFAIWQLEVGKEGGTPHLQGHVRLKARKLQYRIKECLALFQREAGAPILLAIKVSELASIRYCQKGDETYRAGPWKIGIVPTEAKEIKALNTEIKNIDFELKEHLDVLSLRSKIRTYTDAIPMAIIPNGSKIENVKEDQVTEIFEHVLEQVLGLLR